MARPTAFATGVYHLNVRVPNDLAAKARGTRVTLPVGDTPTTVKVGDKVVVSLRTKDVATTKARFATVAAALNRYWDALRSGPRGLTHKQVVALAGEAYRRRTMAFDTDPAYEPDALREKAAMHQESLAEWKHGDDDGLGEMSDEWAAFYAAMQRPYGPQLYAFEHKADITDPCFPMTYECALEDLFGSEADALCAERQLQVDAATRAKLVRQIGEVVRLAGGRLQRNLDGDFSPDATLERFPAFEIDGPVTVATAAARGFKITVDDLFARWCAYNADKRAPSTARRYEPSICSLAKFMKGKDVRQVEQDDVWAWAEHRRDVDGIAAKTVNRNDLVATKSLFNFAATRDSDAKPSGQKKVALRSDNPVRGVKFDLPREPGKKDKVFKAADVRAILTLARSVVFDPKWPKASASRRWAPWICAYSGARVQEVCWLKRANIWCEGDIWVMEFPMTKDGFARVVPLHDALIDEGLVRFWRDSPEGLLFVGGRARKEATKMSAQELRAGDLASWVRANVTMDAHLSPNHSWRHTFITVADGCMTKRMANRLAGHNKRKDASDGYYAPSVKEMKTALDAFPSYLLGTNNLNEELYCITSR